MELVELWCFHKELKDLIESIFRTPFLTVDLRAKTKKTKNTKKIGYDDVI